MVICAIQEYPKLNDKLNFSSHYLKPSTLVAIYSNPSSFLEAYPHFFLN